MQSEQHTEPLIMPMIEYAFMNCMQKAMCTVIAECFMLKAQELDRELTCALSGSTIPRGWGNPEIRTKRHASLTVSNTQHQPTEA